jgi:hypothetical protein
VERARRAAERLPPRVSTARRRLSFDSPHGPRILHASPHASPAKFSALADEILGAGLACAPVGVPTGDAGRRASSAVHSKARRRSVEPTDVSALESAALAFEVDWCAFVQERVRCAASSSARLLARAAESAGVCSHARSQRVAARQTAATAVHAPASVSARFERDGLLALAVFERGDGRRLASSSVELWAQAAGDIRAEVRDVVWFVTTQPPWAAQRLVDAC